MARAYLHRNNFRQLSDLGLLTLVLDPGGTQQSLTLLVCLFVFKSQDAQPGLELLNPSNPPTLSSQMPPCSAPKAF
jgi:hypothetical protein